MRAGPLPAESFRLRPYRDRSWYFSVHVAETAGDLRLAMRVAGLRPSRHQIGACVGCKGTGRWAPVLGLIFLPKHCSAGLAAHELAHAAFRAVERRGVLVEHWLHMNLPARRDALLESTKAEEHYCAVTQRLNTAFWQEMRSRGLT